MPNTEYKDLINRRNFQNTHDVFNHSLECIKAENKMLCELEYTPFNTEKHNILRESITEIRRYYLFLDGVNTKLINADYEDSENYVVDMVDEKPESKTIISHSNPFEDIAYSHSSLPNFKYT